MPQTGVPIVDWFLSALQAWGYLIVFVFTIFENLFVVGSLTPGETIVIAAALVASHDQLSIGLVWIASVIGTMVGSNVSYWLGRRAGIGAVQSTVDHIAATRAGRILRIDASSLDEIEDHFQTEGAKTVLISRFAVGAKNFVPAVAGATRMPVFWYELYTLIGAILYTTLMCIIGWFLGTELEVALKVASGIGYVGLLMLAAFVVGVVFARRKLKGRMRARRTADGQLASCEADSDDSGWDEDGTPGDGEPDRDES